jgi:hypothetical protein
VPQNTARVPRAVILAQRLFLLRPVTRYLTLSGRLRRRSKPQCRRLPRERRRRWSGLECCGHLWSRARRCSGRCSSSIAGYVCTSMTYASNFRSCFVFCFLCRCVLCVTSICRCRSFPEAAAGGDHIPADAEPGRDRVVAAARGARCHLGACLPDLEGHRHLGRLGPVAGYFVPVCAR